MKTYCKNVDIEDISMMELAIRNCFKGKWKRRDIRNLLSRHCEYTPGKILKLLKTGNKHMLDGAVHNLALELNNRLMNRELSLPPTVSRTVIEGAKQKERNLEIESYEHQIFDHLADLGLQELFEKKFGTWQCASIKGRGQLYTKKGIEKWIRTDPQGTKVAIQCDVRKCHQNIDIDVLIAMLERDIHKNKPLLWLTRKLLLIMKEKDKGLFVGSVISKDLANYYMSYLYHYAESKLTVTRRSRRNGPVKVRLLSHQAMYMDDVFLSGSNRKYLMMAFRKIQQCLEEKLHLEFKESWRFYYVEYEDKYGVSHGCPADLAGYVYKRTCTVLRDHIFLKGRRAFKKVKTYLMKGYEVTQRMAQRAVSYYGWFKNSNLHQFMEKYGIEELQKYCKRRLSYLSKRNRAKEALAC